MSEIGREGVYWGFRVYFRMFWIYCGFNVDLVFFSGFYYYERLDWVNWIKRLIGVVMVVGVVVFYDIFGFFYSVFVV